MGSKKISSREVAAQKAIALFPPIFDTSAKEARTIWKKRRDPHPSSNDELLRTIVGPETPLFDRNWTKKDEARLREVWDESSSKPAFENIYGTGTELLRLWKLSSRLMKSSPLAILSPQHGLVYESTQIPMSNGRDNRCQLWSVTFCEALGILVHHSLWNADPKLLTAAIQYAVICRGDIRHPWTLAFGSFSCKAMETMKIVSSERRMRHMYDLCSEYKASQMAHGRQVSLEFDFFCHLGSQIKKTGFEPVTQCSSKAPFVYGVRVSDLKAIIRALDTFSRCGQPMFTHSDILVQAGHSICLGKSFPIGAQLQQMHIRSFLHETRMSFRNTIEASPASSSLQEILAPAPRGCSSVNSTPLGQRNKRKRSPVEVIVIEDEDDVEPHVIQGLPAPVRHGPQSLGLENEPRKGREKKKGGRVEDIVIEDGDEVEPHVIQGTPAPVQHAPQSLGRENGPRDGRNKKKAKRNRNKNQHPRIKPEPSASNQKENTSRQANRHDHQRHQSGSSQSSQSSQSSSHYNQPDSHPNNGGRSLDLYRTGRQPHKGQKVFGRFNAQAWM